MILRLLYGLATVVSAACRKCYGNPEAYRRKASAVPNRPVDRRKAEADYLDDERDEPSADDGQFESLTLDEVWAAADAASKAAHRAEVGLSRHRAEHAAADEPSPQSGKSTDSGAGRSIRAGQRTGYRR